MMYYFAYASNLNKQRMQQACPDSRPKFAAVLPNYRIIFTGWSREWHGGKANLRSAQGGKVSGAVYEVTEACLRKLDRQEAGYSRMSVTVFSEDNEPVAAVTYIKQGQTEDAAPSKEYLAVIQQGYRDWSLF